MLLYNLEHGDTADFISDMAKRMGQPQPDRFANAPELETGLVIYYNAFWDLDSERQLGMSIGRIPWSKIILYADVYEFDRRQRKLLIHFVKALDNEYIKHIVKQLEKK